MNYHWVSVVRASYYINILVATQKVCINPLFQTLRVETTKAKPPAETYIVHDEKPEAQDVVHSSAASTENVEAA